MRNKISKNDKNLLLAKKRLDERKLVEINEENKLDYFQNRYGFLIK